MNAERDMTSTEESSLVDALDTSFPDFAADDPFATTEPDLVGSQRSGGTHRQPGAQPTSGFGPAISVNGSRGQHEGHDPELDDDVEPLADEGESSRVTRLAYGRHIRVLLIESDPDNADAFSHAADESVLDVRVEAVADATAGVLRLERSVGPRLRRPLPDVVVVSLDMPDAHNFLELVHDDIRFDGLPIIVLAESSSPEAERRSFALGATAHLVAPRRDYERVALIHALPDFIPRARAVHAHLESRSR